MPSRAENRVSGGRDADDPDLRMSGVAWVRYRLEQLAASRPVLVTADEFDGSRAVMTARVNGVERSRVQLADLHYPWPAILAQAARNTELRPGDIIGSGTVGTGCILELGTERHRWLLPGDVVEMEIERLGMLRNTLIEKKES